MIPGMGVPALNCGCAMFALPGRLTQFGPMSPLPTFITILGRCSDFEYGQGQNDLEVSIIVATVARQGSTS